VRDVPPDGLAGLASGADGKHSAGRRVEIVGPHLRITGRLELGTFRRVTDLVNSNIGLFRLRDARVLLRDGQSANLAVGDLWVSPNEVTVIAEMETRREPRSKDGAYIPKTSTALAIVTPGHTLTGRIYAPPEASLEVFLQSPEPAFLPMTDLRVRSLIDRQVEADYPFALVSRRHLIAASAVVEPPPASSTSLFDRLR
jgi:hypothetical protein